jgi:prolyl 4-hydroxylase
LTMDANELTVKEQTIFHHVGNKIKTEDREINIIARLEEPLIMLCRVSF